MPSTRIQNPAAQNPAVGRLKGANFHVDVTNGHSQLVADDESVRIRLEDMDTESLIRLKELAHNQYVLAMISDSPELDVHRATLNHVCRIVERRGNPVNRPARAASRYADRTKRRINRMGTAA